MSMVDEQSSFAHAVADLIKFAIGQGFQVTFGDAYRDPRCPYGHPKSFHKKRLAIDLNLFRNGKYLTTAADHVILGRKWEDMGGTWGGRFDLNGDGVEGDDANHYSWGESPRR